ncbi:tyrosine n-monooxygenase [Hordeum vulgare]|nr:tyrosine n-monooxygenase [Hordeum vulgare]
MDDCTYITLTPPYARDPAVVVGANPSAGTSSFASVGASPTTGLVCGLFMAPGRERVATPAVKPRAPFSKLLNVAVAKKDKVSGKKNKAANGSSRRPEKKLAGRAKDAAATEAREGSLAASTGYAHNVFDEMPPSSLLHKNLFQGEGKKTKKGRMKKGRSFTLPHCYEVLKDDEKWKPHEGVNEETNKHKRSPDLDDNEAEPTSDDGKRSPTPNSVAYSRLKRPNEGKKDAKEKKKRKGNDELTIFMEAIVNARKEANGVRKMARNQYAAAEVRRLAAEERRVALKEKKLAMEEQTRLLEWDKPLIFVDTSTLDEKQKEHVDLTREEVLVQKEAWLASELPWEAWEAWDAWVPWEAWEAWGHGCHGCHGKHGRHGYH